LPLKKITRYIESLFKFIGSIKGAAEIGGLIFNFALTYFIGKGNKATWLAVGMVVLGVSSFVRTLPHFVFGSGLSGHSNNTLQNSFVNTPGKEY